MNLDKIKGSENIENLDEETSRFGEFVSSYFSMAYQLDKQKDRAEANG